MIKPKQKEEPTTETLSWAEIETIGDETPLEVSLRFVFGSPKRTYYNERESFIEAEWLYNFDADWDLVENHLVNQTNGFHSDVIGDIGFELFGTIDAVSDDADCLLTDEEMETELSGWQLDCEERKLRTTKMLIADIDLHVNKVHKTRNEIKKFFDSKNVEPQTSDYIGRIITVLPKELKLRLTDELRSSRGLEGRLSSIISEHHLIENTLNEVFGILEGLEPNPSDYIQTIDDVNKWFDEVINSVNEAQYLSFYLGSAIKDWDEKHQIAFDVMEVSRLTSSSDFDEMIGYMIAKINETVYHWKLSGKDYAVVKEDLEHWIFENDVIIGRLDDFCYEIAEEFYDELEELQAIFDKEDW